MTPAREPDAGRTLARALARIAPEATIATHAETPWASATFVGTQHVLRLDCADGAIAAAVAGRLVAADFGVRGHVVADIAAVAEGCAVRVEVLTLVAA